MIRPYTALAAQVAPRVAPFPSRDPSSGYLQPNDVYYSGTGAGSESIWLAHENDKHIYMKFYSSQSL